MMPHSLMRGITMPMFAENVRNRNRTNSKRRRPRLERLEERQLLSTASFLGTNTTTQGNWIGTYGTQGYDVINDAASLPSSVTVTPAQESNFTWTANTTDVRALQDASGSGRLAACWYANNSFTVEVNLTDGQTHDLALYFLDWDSTTRAEQVQISDASTGAVLDTENVKSFNSGDYLDWAVSGNVLITLSRTSGANAVLSGLFLDTPPTVTAETPASGATGVAVTSPLTATFNEAVQSGTISFTLTPSGGSPVAAKVTYNSSNFTATLTPSAALAYNTTYTATVSGAENSAGDPMSGPFSWSFTTDPAAPKVTSETPASGATNVAVSTTATATFNEAVQSGTISFTLTPSGGSPVAATLSYNSSNFTATLTPSTALAYNTTYTATVSGAKDSAGDPMSGPFSWSFTTAASTGTTTATFIKQDTTTQGNWIGTYGSQGYNVINDAASLPSYATVTPKRGPGLLWTRKHDRPAGAPGCRRLRPHRRLLVLGIQFHRRREPDRWPDARPGVVLRRLGQHQPCRAGPDQQRLHGDGPF